MSDGILKDILALEQQIEAELGREQERAERWFANVCRAIDQELHAEQDATERATKQQSAAEIRCARQAAAQKLYQGRRRARRLIELPERTLLPFLAEPLQTVMTGRADDCPHGKG
ncbi:MAG: hypothetical protein IBX47_05705 [Desulfuromonadales bacterium]|nr:hypothetical protein [Desulfuromonadales bacterium]